MPYTFTIESRFHFGDVVQFTSPNGSGRGKILDIVLMSDMFIYYIIEAEDGIAYGGIMPDDVSLITPAHQN